MGCFGEPYFDAGMLDLWEIIVPVAHNNGTPFSDDQHEAFRRILRQLPGNNGATTRPAGDGVWKERDSGRVCAEKMIPIRFRACRADAKRIAEHACTFYDQIVVMACRIAAGQHIILAGPTSNGNETTEAR
jgi:hypothetical protein